MVQTLFLHKLIKRSGQEDYPKQKIYPRYTILDYACPNFFRNVAKILKEMIVRGPSFSLGPYRHCWSSWSIPNLKIWTIIASNLYWFPNPRILKTFISNFPIFLNKSEIFARLPIQAPNFELYSWFSSSWASKGLPQF